MSDLRDHCRLRISPKYTRKEFRDLRKSRSLRITQNAMSSRMLRLAPPTPSAAASAAPAPAPVPEVVARGAGAGRASRASGCCCSDRIIALCVCVCAAASCNCSYSPRPGHRDYHMVDPPNPADQLRLPLYHTLALQESEAKRHPAKCLAGAKQVTFHRNRKLYPGVFWPRTLVAPWQSGSRSWSTGFGRVHHSRDVQRGATSSAVAGRCGADAGAEGDEYIPHTSRPLEFSKSIDSTTLDAQATDCKADVARHTRRHGHIAISNP